MVLSFHVLLLCCSSVSLLGKMRLLDVGSCFNPFLTFDEFLTVGIDIVPAVEVRDTIHSVSVGAKVFRLDQWWSFKTKRIPDFQQTGRTYFVHQ